MTGKQASLTRARKALVESRRGLVMQVRRPRRRQHDGARRTATEPKEIAAVRLVPDVRNRLQVRLVAMGVSPERIVSHVARLTSRAAQSVRRWFDSKTPGLPDLESFARLCAGLGCSADEIIGLPHAGQSVGRELRAAAVVADGIYALTDALTHRGGVGEPMRVPGDEMEPQLREGDLIFVDTAIDRPMGNGIYALEHDGRLLIRRLELRLGDRLVLKCDNRAYGDWELKAGAATRRSGLRILGKVQGAIGMRVF